MRDVLGLSTPPSTSCPIIVKIGKSASPSPSFIFIQPINYAVLKFSSFIFAVEFSTYAAA